MTTPIGYTLGPDYTKVTDFSGPVAVEALTPEQAALKEHIEISKRTLDEAKAALEQALSECTHPVFEDRDGFIYYNRSCVLCGKHIDII